MAFFSEFVPFRAFFDTFLYKFYKHDFSDFGIFEKKRDETAQIQLSKFFRKSQKSVIFRPRVFTFLTNLQKPILVSKFFL